MKQTIEDKGGLILIETAKAEAYKECIEKVKEISPLRFNVEHTEYYDKPSIDKMVLFIDDNDLDNLLKELVGDDNATN